MVAVSLLLYPTLRLKLLGYVSFFGEDEASTSKAAGLDWLSGKAWGAALQAADDHDMDSCTSLLAAYASLLEAHPSRAKVTQVWIVIPEHRAPNHTYLNTI